MAEIENDRPLRVFVSYSHDSQEHKDDVLALADRLRGEGIDARLDQYEPAPAEGWLKWMKRQIRDADFVLMVCTETYRRRFDGDEAPKRGRGVTWEGAIVSQELYNAQMRNTRFVPVVLAAKDGEHIPIELQASTWYAVREAEGYEALYRHLTGQPAIRMPELGEPVPLEAAPIRIWNSSSPATQEDLLALYLKHVRQAHRNLVPLLPEIETGLGLLDKVYVEVQLRPDALAKEKTSADSLRTLQAMELRELLALRKESHPEVTGRWVLRGDPGTGKTTMLRHLTYRLAGESAAERPWVPLFVSLPQILQEKGWVLDGIEELLCQAGYPAKGLATALEEQGRQGKLLVLLDGLDEVGEENRQRAEQLIVSIATRWLSTPVVVTSRPIPYQAFSETFLEAELQPLAADQRHTFLARWFGRKSKAPDAKRAEHFLEKLQADPGLWDLAGNPLYLTLLALLSDAERPVLPNRSELYKEVLGLLLKGEHKVPALALPHREKARPVLAQLAYALTRDNQDRESLDGLVTRLHDRDSEVSRLRESLFQVRRWERNPDDFFYEVAERTAILRPERPRSTDWRFLHRSFREALTAECLRECTKGKKGWKGILDRARKISGDESRWAEPYALLVGQVDEPDSLVRALVKENRALGLRALATAQGLQEETITEVLELTGANIEERGAAMLRIPELLGEAERSCRLLDRLRRETRSGDDLYFLYEALSEVERLYPDEARFASGLRDRFFDHIPAPDADLFRWVETPKDGRVPLWREIPAGEFCMGSPEGDDDEHPLHRVRVLSAFAMGSVPVTNAQYAAFDPAKVPWAWKGVSEEELAFHPRVEVSWYEAVSFCRWLSGHIRGARLPTEAEWEYACRAGTESRYWSGGEESDLARVGWYKENAEGRTHRVGDKEANGWGLYDVHGNVLEWTSSPWSKDYSDRRDGAEIDSQGPSTPAAPRGVYRVIRGGSFWDSADGARAAYRFIRLPWLRVVVLGFRVVLPAVPEL